MRTIQPNYSSMFPIIYFDRCSTKESAMGDPKNLVLHHRLNEAANTDDADKTSMIFTTVLNEEEIMIKQVENE